MGIRKPRRAVVDEYTQEQVDFLLTGRRLFHHPFGRDDETGEPDHDAIRQAWTQLRDRLLREWLRAHPGSRPYAWWLLDAPEPRRCTNGVHPFDNPARQRRIASIFGRADAPKGRELSRGVPRNWFLPSDGEAQYETERDYLDRLGLLSDAERAALLTSDSDGDVAVLA